MAEWTNEPRAAVAARNAKPDDGGGQEHSFADVARMLGISVGAVRTRLIRARVNLRYVLKCSEEE